MIWTQQQITQWSEKTFGKSLTATVIAARANEEMAELIRETASHPEGSPRAMEEIADCTIVLYRLASMCGGNLMAEIDRKMDINVKREWNLRGDGTGQHV
jgi:NTP pyrophosphatase (non-canonical NTP hydrolase)